jgi:glycosyltransferase involved in cell wall biosynthesis
LNQSTTYIIIPAFNEDPKILYEVASRFVKYQIIVVDDGSAIPVKEQFEGFEKLNNLFILRLNENVGQGGALEAGVKLALEKGGEIFCTVDGDGQHEITSCEAIIDAFAVSDCDILLGSRFLDGHSKVPLVKKIFLKGGILINYWYSGLLLQDAHCGLRVFGKAFANKLQFFNKRHAHASEIIWIINKYHFRYKEFPVKIIYSAYSMQKGQSVLNSFNILKDLVKHKFHRKSKAESKPL